ncbi:MAG: 3-keto-disaccharide hydrolase, partial [Bacteroidota bacterium]
MKFHNSELYKASFNISIFLCLLFILSCQPAEEKKENWISLFNGKDLNDWVIKINHHELNENYNNTFRVRDSLLVVDYSEYDTITNDFGHIFYNKPFSKYKLRVEYRFTGEQVPGGAGWAYRNNGVMFHCQDPETILLDQAFPVSIEAQLLGQDEQGGERPTGNVCTPGTHIEMAGELITQHCFPSGSKTYP